MAEINSVGEASCSVGIPIGDGGGPAKKGEGIKSVSLEATSATQPPRSIPWHRHPLLRRFWPHSKAPESSAENNSVKEAGHHVELPKDHFEALEEMKKMVCTSDRGLSGAPADRRNPSIFKGPAKFQTKEYVPQVASIGPYYRGEPHLDRMEQIKRQCLAHLTDKSSKGLDEYWNKVYGLEQEARTYYSEPVGLNSVQLVETMVLDGCFTLEFFLFYLMNDEAHPIARIERKMLPEIFSDLLLLGNQVPFPVLEGLFEICGSQFPSGVQLPILMGKVFLDTMGIQCLRSDLSSVFSKDPNNERGSKHWQPLHLLDMVRSCLVPSHLLEGKGSRYFHGRSMLRLVPNTPSISKLRHVGMKVNLRGRDHFWEVEFQSGVIKMSKMVLNDLMSSFLVSCVEFEHSYDCPYKAISSYVVFLDCLVNTAEDVDYLRENGVLQHYKENDNLTADFINGLGKTLAFDVIDRGIILLHRDINEYYETMLHRQRSWLYQRWENFKREYFDKPWVWISVFAGSVLLVLTFLQTYQAMRKPASST